MQKKSGLVVFKKKLWYDLKKKYQFYMKKIRFMMRVNFFLNCWSLIHVW